MAQPTTIGATRLQQELADIQYAKTKVYHVEDAGNTVPNKWFVLLLPDQFPYNAGGYKIEIEFGKEYPFKAPKIRFITKIYHPNINERGEISMPMISAENWKPSLKVDQVLNALADLLGSPQLDCALRADLAELYVKDAKSFDQNALEFCRLYSAKRTPA